MLVHIGAICVVCDDRSLYESPHRTSPPITKVLSLQVEPDRDHHEIAS